MSPQCGGLDVFIGTVRAKTLGKPVATLEYEAYDKMALNEMRKITAQAFIKWPVAKLLIHHRTGILHIGDVAVIIAVAAAHREAAFEACRFTIDTLKQTVPIWKKEVFENEEIRAESHP